MTHILQQKGFYSGMLCSLEMASDASLFMASSLYLESGGVQELSQMLVMLNLLLYQGDALTLLMVPYVSLLFCCSRVTFY